MPALVVPSKESTPGELAERYWALRELPAFPSIATKLLQLASDPNVDVNKLAGLLRSDASFSAEMLRRANSALYGLSSEVSSLRQAVMLLGLDQIKSLALALCIGSYLRSALNLAPLRRCWRHSLTTAILAEKSATPAQADIAYTAGILHDIGLFGLMVNYPNEYASMLVVAQENQFDLLATERALFDLDHCEAGAWLARQWKFPRGIEDVTLRHHIRPENDDLSMPAHIYRASAVASALGFAISGPLEPEPDAYGGLMQSPLFAGWGKKLPEDGDLLRQKITEKLNALE